MGPAESQPESLRASKALLHLTQLCYTGDVHIAMTTSSSVDHADTDFCKLSFNVRHQSCIPADQLKAAMFLQMSLPITATAVS